MSEGVDDLRLSEPSFWLRPDRAEAFLLLRREAPVSWQEEPETIWSDGGRGYWAVTRHADVQRVSRETKVHGRSDCTRALRPLESSGPARPLAG